MIRRKRIVQWVIGLMLVAFMAACASTPSQSSAGEFIDDSVITTKVKALLAAENLLKSFEIGVETYKGTVQLSGFVGSKEAVHKAEQIARSVQGVKAVRNDLIVK